MQYLVEMRNVSKQFPGVLALDNVTLKVRAGTVHALMGENGAGKSTLMKCLCGMYSVDSGSIVVDGKNVKLDSVKAALDLGISIVQQELSPIPDMTVMENIWLGREPRKGQIFVNSKKMYNDTVSLLKNWDMQLDPNAKLKEYSLSNMQMVEIIKAVSRNCRIIILDEPTSALSDREVDKLFRIIERLKKEGMGIVYISHKMDEVFKIADDITVFRDGKLIATHGASETCNAELVREMVGRDIEEWNDNKMRKVGDVVLKVDDIHSGKEVNGVSFELHKGEVLGISGLVGAGRTELLKTIFGLRKIDRGFVEINGNRICGMTPQKAIENRIAIITEDRRGEGIIPLMSVSDNLALASLPKNKDKIGFYDQKKSDKSAGEFARLLGVKTPTLEEQIQNLSGGNQQKVIVARWLMTHADIFLFDEPTRGIDVGAKSEIHNLIIELTKQGKAVVMVSSEIPEVLKVSDRILVMKSGIVTGEMSRAQATEELIIHYAMAV